MQRLLSMNSILMIGGGLLVLLILLIILLVINSKRNAQQEMDAQQDEATDTAQLNLPRDATAYSLFRDQNLAKLVAATLNVRTTDHLDEKQLLQIKRLDGTAKDIENLDGIDLLRNLEIVNLGSNKLTTLPSAIKELERLHELRIDNNKIDDISHVVGSKSLRTLDISDNRITELAEDIFTMPNLEHFSAQRNQIEHISSEMMSAPSRIHDLDLSQNSLRAIPGTIRNMSELSSLNLASNMLTDIPLEIGNLEKIRRLDVSRNASLVIPDSLKQKLLSKSVEVHEDAHDGRFGEIQSESFDIIDNNSDGVVELLGTQADDGGLDDMKNTYIDLTSSNDDLLNEIAALERNLGDPIPHIVSQDTTESQLKDVSFADQGIGHNNSSDWVNTTLNDGRSPGLYDNNNVNGGAMQQMNELQITEVEKKEKRKKLLKLAGVVAGATFAAVTITGASIYLLKRSGDNKGRGRRQNGYFFTKKRR